MPATLNGRTTAWSWRPSSGRSWTRSDAAYVGHRLLTSTTCWAVGCSCLRSCATAARRVRAHPAVAALVHRRDARRRARARRPLAEQLADCSRRRRGARPRRRTGHAGTRLPGLGWEVTVLDLPEVIDLMADELAQAGIAAIKGDATQGIPVHELRPGLLRQSLPLDVAGGVCAGRGRAPPPP